MLNIFKNKFFIGVFVFGLGFVGFYSSVEAATCTAITGNWNTTGTWSCGHVPLDSDDVVVPTNVDVTINVAGAVANTVTMQNAVGANNNISMNAPGTLDVTGAVSIAASTGAGTSTLSVGDATLTMAGITITGGGAAGESRLLVSTGSVTSSSGITFAGTAATAKLTASDAATIALNGTTGTLGTGGTVSLNSDSIFALNGTGDQLINVYGYGHLTINKPSGTATLAGNVTSILGNLIVASGTFSTSTYNIDVTGSTAIEDGAILIHGTGTKVHNGVVAVEEGGTWTETGAALVTFINDLSNEGTFTASTGVHTFAIDERDVYGDVSIPSVTFSGNVTNHGTLTISTTLRGAQTLTNATGATLNIGDAEVDDTADGFELNAGAVGNIVNYTRAGAQIVFDAVGSAYDDLELSGSGVKTISAGTSIAGTLTISDTATADLDGDDNTADLLIFEDEEQYQGTWGSEDSSARYKDDGHFTEGATGIIDIMSGEAERTRSSSGSSRRSPSEKPATPVVVSRGVTCVQGEMYSSTTGEKCTGVVVQNPNMSYAFGTTLVKMGTKGEACKAWQMFFNDKGHAGLVADGICGPKTMTFAKSWQASAGLTADGLLGAMSRAKAMMQ